MASRRSASCIARFRGLCSGVKLYNYRTLRHLACQWRTIECLQLYCQALDEETLTGVYRSGWRRIPVNFNIQSLIAVSLQQRFVEFSQNSGCSDISTIALYFALTVK